MDKLPACLPFTLTNNPRHILDGRCSFSVVPDIATVTVDREKTAPSRSRLLLQAIRNAPPKKTPGLVPGLG